MDDAALVGIVEGIRNLNSDVYGVVNLQRTRGKLRRQELPFHVLHDEEHRACVLTDIVDGGDVRRAKRRGGTGFGHQTPAPLGIVLQRGQQELQRDRTTQADILGQIHFAHPASPEPFAHAVVLDG